MLTDEHWVTMNKILDAGYEKNITFIHTKWFQTDIQRPT